MNPEIGSARACLLHSKAFYIPQVPGLTGVASAAAAGDMAGDPKVRDASFTKRLHGESELASIALFLITWGFKRLNLLLVFSARPPFWYHQVFAAAIARGSPVISAAPEAWISNRSGQSSFLLKRFVRCLKEQSLCVSNNKRCQLGGLSLLSCKRGI